MTLLAILLDLVMAGTYYVQVAHPSSNLYWVGFIVQIVVLIGLIWTMAGYCGRKYKNPWVFGRFTASVGYGVVLFSMVVAAIMVGLYALNLFAGNSVVFGG